MKGKREDITVRVIRVKSIIAPWKIFWEGENGLGFEEVYPSGTFSLRFKGYLRGVPAVYLTAVMLIVCRAVRYFVYRAVIEASCRRVIVTVMSDVKNLWEWVVNG